MFVHRIYPQPGGSLPAHVDLPRGAQERRHMIFMVQQIHGDLIWANGNRHFWSTLWITSYYSSWCIMDICGLNPSLSMIAVFFLTFAKRLSSIRSRVQGLDKPALLRPQESLQFTISPIRFNGKFTNFGHCLLKIARHSNSLWQLSTNDYIILHTWH